MKKCLCFAAALLLLGTGLYAEQRLPVGAQAIFLKSGEIISGKIVDFVTPQLELKLGDGNIVAVRDVWMINFENTDWNFPDERNILETNDHYVFLKNGDISSGQIASFTAAPPAFVFETGEIFPLVQCRRIYFSKTVPRGLR
ncbi:MAG: hypothetical protein ACYDH3_04520 [Candidatus Aminicenantales bacterium]